MIIYVYRLTSTTSFPRFWVPPSQSVAFWLRILFTGGRLPRRQPGEAPGETGAKRERPRRADQSRIKGLLILG